MSDKLPEKRVRIATPAYDGKVHAGYAQSMLLAGYVLAKCGMELSATIACNNAFIDSARSLLVQAFLASNCTHLVFVDADLEFPDCAIAALVNAELPLCAGMYCSRHKQDKYTMRMPDHKVVERDGWIQAERIPAGFMCIERSVLEVMSERAENFRINDTNVPLVFKIKRENGRMIGEDFSFCDDYMELYREGVFKEPIWVWPDIDFEHDGIKCNFHEWLNG